VIDIATAFAVVFLAELGDKTQLVALTLAGRYRAGQILAVLGVTIAVLQLLSVTVGALLGEVLPPTAIGLGAGLLFLAFAVWTWRSAADPDDDGPAQASRRGLLGAAAAFFLAELGDKTMLTTAGLAADRGPVPVWVGATAALFAATVLAVTVGRALTRRIGHATLARVGAVAFAVVGVATIVGTLA
jgi:Ca2+/H+ antiporter, TMEM165/GDT1 family